MAGASLRDIRGRIKSIESTKKITKAMELVASSKVRKARENAERTKVFYDILDAAITELESSGGFENVFSKKREVKKICYIVIAGDRGLAGGFNNNVFKLVAEDAGDIPYCVMPIGKKALEHFVHIGKEIVYDKYPLTSEMHVGSCVEIGKLVAGGFRKGDFDRVCVVYTEFVSMISQVASLKNVLPLPKKSDVENGPKMLTLYEPEPEEIYEKIVPQYISGTIYNAVCESLASEYAARRSAMDSATKNATEMIDDLTLKYNRARQNVITQELNEIVAGAEAL
ncbi:MAG: ATP synthase F1 subunit gamma [Ruminococcaceae bacterium]|nr:ATP synthase F1 subunit gamma [Oscillospiraceae bacterium]